MQSEMDARCGARNGGQGRADSVAPRAEKKEEEKKKKKEKKKMEKENGNEIGGVVLEVTLISIFSGFLMSNFSNYETH